MNPSESTREEFQQFDPETPAPGASIQGAAQTAKEKLEAAGSVAREKLEAAGSVAREKLQAAGSVAKEQLQAVGSTTLQWVRENPATALATIFASGLAIGFALARGARQPTFQEKFSEDPVDTIREAVFSALSPIGARLQNVAQSARSAAEKATEQIHDYAGSTGAWWDKFRRNNYKS